MSGERGHHLSDLVPGPRKTGPKELAVTGGSIDHRIKALTLWTVRDFALPDLI